MRYNHFNIWQKAFDECETDEQYAALCASHDWFWYMSDANLSSAPSDRLKDMARKGSAEWKRIYNAAHAENFNNASFVTPDRPYTPPF